MALHHGPLTQLSTSVGETFGSRPSLQFSVPCLEVADEEGKPPSFKWLFYELPFPQFPFKVSFFVANGWCNGVGDYIQSMSILQPDKQNVLVETGKQPFKLSERSVPFMAVNFFQDIIFEEPGVYWMQVFLNGGMILEYPLTVRRVER
ncbi:MAG: hypothetical protein HY319_05690 [Armatimonadetes bacterium]|nr:hypothetical protein [Armatimonadota bacterium]